MRLAAFDDSIYRRDANGELTVHRSFPVFMFGIGPEFDRLTVLGRFDPEPGREHHVVPDTGTFVPLPFYESATQVGAVLRAAVGTARTTWRVLGDVDAVWINGPGPISLLIAFLAVARRRRIVLGVRQNTRAIGRSRYPGKRLMILGYDVMEALWRGLARIGRVAPVGPELREVYSWAPRVQELAVSFVGNADIAGPEVVEAREGAGGDVTLLTVSRLETEKNPMLLADVLAALGPGYRMQIVGEGDLEGPLRARLEELGVADRAEFLGYVSIHDGLYDYYRAADQFLHVSWTEGLPQVLLEAFAARLPTVATAVGGVPGIAEGAALLVPPGDPEAAAAAVRRLAGDPALRAELVAEGLERARARTTEAELSRLAAFIAADDPAPVPA